MSSLTKKANRTLAAILSLFLGIAPSFAEQNQTLRSQPPTKEWPAQKWTLSRDGTAFARDIGQLCLTSPQSKIIPEGNSLTVSDHPTCVKEVQALSLAWQNAAPGSYHAVHSLRHYRKQVKQMFARKYGRLPASDLGVLAKTAHCDCVVFTGSRSSEIADYLRQRQAR